MLRYSLLSILGVFLILSCNKEIDSPEGEKPSIVLEGSSIVNAPHTAYVTAKAIFVEWEGYDSVGFCIDTKPMPDKSVLDPHSLYPISSTVKWGWTYLTANETYYVRAIIYGSKGTIYSNEIKFTTAAYTELKLPTLKKELMVFDSVFHLQQSWSDQPSTSGANSVDDGKANTQKIAANNATGAAKFCDDLVYAGYDDWYLPAQQEMLELVHVFGRLHDGGYWTSTEVDDMGAISCDWPNQTPGSFMVSEKQDKIKPLNMVCIREK